MVGVLGLCADEAYLFALDIPVLLKCVSTLVTDTVVGLNCTGDALGVRGGKARSSPQCLVRTGAGSQSVVSCVTAICPGEECNSKQAFYRGLSKAA